MTWGRGPVLQRELEWAITALTPYVENVADHPPQDLIPASEAAQLFNVDIPLICKWHQAAVPGLRLLPLRSR
jgi:hypothetical protein